MRGAVEFMVKTYSVKIGSAVIVPLPHLAVLFFGCRCLLFTRCFLFYVYGITKIQF